MGLIEIASGNSVWRGMDYYNAKKVISWDKTGEFTYRGIVSGSNGEKYEVSIDKEHPRKSKCNCLFADGRRVVCKHMIALLFTAEPKQADDFIQMAEQYEEEEELREQEHLADVMKYVKSLSKVELQHHLYDALLEIEYYKNIRW